jgi:glyoxylase-like metal-dependent hydrolase (beta-lactamase superfamily II)
MKLYPIITERWMTDGGAVFGVVPKSIWRRLCPSDELNNVPTCVRCLLVDTGDRIILFDTGMGNKQNEKFYSYRFIYGDESLDKAFDNIGYRFEDVTDIIFTHLHYDHVGGAFRRKLNEQTATPVFPNARYWCSARQWQWATNPNVREAASYLSENLNPIIESGKLHFIEKEGFFTENIYLRMFHGHTDGQIIPIIEANGKTLAFVADFIPTVFHLPLPYIPAFDTRPLLSMEEKEQFLNEAFTKNYYLIFEHDPETECCSLTKTEKGIRADKKFILTEPLSEKK